MNHTGYIDKMFYRYHVVYKIKHGVEHNPVYYDICYIKTTIEKLYNTYLTLICYIKAKNGNWVN